MSIGAGRHKSLWCDWTQCMHGGLSVFTTHPFYRRPPKQGPSADPSPGPTRDGELMIGDVELDQNAD